jgi:hypothetical protein
MNMVKRPLKESPQECSHAENDAASPHSHSIR